MFSSLPPIVLVRPRSIVDGADRAVAMVLGAAGLTRALHGITVADGVALVDALHGAILANYMRERGAANKDRSPKNWRWRVPQLNMAPHNPSAEVIVEKAIARACERLRREDWANQVPVSSGLIAGRSDARRAIDLVRRRGDGHFELIELKVRSNDPFHAAREVIGYASLWLIARGDPPSRGSALLDADRIDVRVLAPAAYYRRFPVAPAEAALDAGVRALGRRHGVAMTFAYELLDERIRHDAIPADAALMALMERPERATRVGRRMTSSLFMPGVPEAHVRARFERAGGNEIGSGNLWSPVSSAVLAANVFGWFIERPALLPPLPGATASVRPERIEIEYCARFPWAGGRHPWLDAALFGAGHLVGVESKRFEPFRDRKEAAFSPAYDRPVWGDRMGRYGAIRDALRSGALRYAHLNAAQLVKHAFGLVTQGRRSRLQPMLFYVFAEPTAVDGRPVVPAEHNRHREEIVDFAARVYGDEVSFFWSSYRRWLGGASGPAADHAAAVIARYDL